jgi:DNA-binding IscR family transcriptional regulator
VAELDDVSVLQVIEMIDGPTDAGRCVVADRPCDARDRCILHDPWADARAELVRALGSTPLSMLAARRQRAASAARPR